MRVLQAAVPRGNELRSSQHGGKCHYNAACHRGIEIRDEEQLKLAVFCGARPHGELTDEAASATDPWGLERSAGGVYELGAGFEEDDKLPFKAALSPTCSCATVT
eukprot:4128155-Amphidinium_carterae.1